MIISKKRYLQGFGVCVVILGFVRMANPSWGISTANKTTTTDSIESKSDTTSAIATTAMADSAAIPEPKTKAAGSIFCSEKKHPIYSVPSYANTFPDINDVQIVPAQKFGIDPIHQVGSPMDCEQLVYVGESPYYDVAKLHASEPYLVPRAAQLLQDIGRAYADSLQVKRIPAHHFIVTSLLRTREHVDKLRRHNGNATENSCHLYATTFDISYNRYNRVCAPDAPTLPPTRSDSLKWVLSEVLRDMRESGRCYVKYEVKQGCFHITVR